MGDPNKSESSVDHYAGLGLILWKRLFEFHFGSDEQFKTAPGVSNRSCEESAQQKNEVSA